MNAERERLLVELVSPDGHAVGTATVEEAHRRPGLLHRAFSVLLVDPDGRVLLQQRAPTKTRFPSRWANSCCGHPGPGQGVVAAARQRLVEELGIRDVDLAEVGTFTYAAVDPATDRVEREYDHVLVGAVPVAVVATPDPAEVCHTRWISTRELRAEMAAELASSYAPWLEGVLNVASRSPLLRA